MTDKLDRPGDSIPPSGPTTSENTPALTRAREALRFIPLAVALLLAGCHEISESQEHALAEPICKDHGGVWDSGVTYWRQGFELEVRCMDGYGELKRMRYPK